MKFFICLLLLFIFPVIPVNGDSKGKIYWMTINYPPAYIVHGPDKNTGINDVALKKMIENLNIFSHEIIENVTMPRMLNFFKSKKTFCSPGLAITKNQFKNTVWSTPILIIPPAGVVVLKSNMGRFKISKNGVDLKKTFSDQSLSAGIMKGGQYGSHIDGLIKKHRGQSNIYQKTPISQFAFLNMLLVGRVDYLIDYPISFYSNLKKLSIIDQKKLQFIAVASVKDIKMIRALCNHNNQGKNLINRLNHLLRSEEYKDPVINRLLDFLPMEIRDRYRKINMKLIGSNI